MAKNENEPRTSIDAIHDSLVGVEQKVENNQKLIMWATLGIAAVVVIVLVYLFLIRRPGIAKANDAIGKADIELALGNDSIALEAYKQVADKYGYAAGNRANLNAAILLYQKGEYEQAAKYLDNYDAKESVIGAAAKSLEGDCYVNLKNYDKALSCYRKAVKISDENPQYTPIFMMKEATVQRELKNYKAEAEIYQKIVDEYPSFPGSYEKYLNRALEQAEYN